MYSTIPNLSFVNPLIKATSGCWPQPVAGSLVWAPYRCYTDAGNLPKEPIASARFLIVTFTVAATNELKDRLAHDSEFECVRDQATVTTLNAYGYRRIRNQVRDQYPSCLQQITTGTLLCEINSGRPGLTKNSSSRSLQNLVPVPEP